MGPAIGKRGPLVFLHGWGTDYSVWQRQVSIFSHGGVVFQPTLQSWKKEAVMELFNEAGLDEAILVGWSLGAMLALEAFAEVKGHLAGLVIVAGAARFCMSEDYRAGIAPAYLRAMKQRLQRDVTSTLQDFYRLFFTNQEEQSRLDFEQLTFPQPSAQSCIEGLDYLMNMDLRSLLPFVDKPTLIVHGEQDQVTPLAHAEFLHCAIKGSRLRVFEDCGHMPFYSRPHIFNPILEEFCRVC